MLQDQVRLGIVVAKEYISAEWTVTEKKMELPPRIGLGIILGLLGQSLTYMGPHTRLWVWSFDTT